MTSKKSFLVNIRTNARRRVWLAVIMFLGFFFTLPVMTAMTLSAEKMYSSYKNMPLYLGKIFAAHIGLNAGMGLLISVLAVISAVQGFSYMYQRKKLDMYMSIPVTKNKRFAAIYVNGITIYLLSYLLNILFSFLVARAMGADITPAFEEMAAALIGNTVLYLAVYHIAILAVMLTGNVIVTLIAAALMLCYDGLVELLLISYMNTFFSSYYYKTEELLVRWMVTPIIRFVIMLGDAVTYQGYIYMRVLDWGKLAAGILPILAVGAIALALAYWCYTKKPSEACGRSMAFPGLKTPLKVLITVWAGLEGGVVFYGLSGSSMAFFIFGMLAGTLLCHGIVEVIYDFDIRSVKNGWKSLLVSAAAVAAVFCIFQFDLMRYDSYVPAPEQVEHIAFRFLDSWENYYDEELNSLDSEQYILDNMRITDIQPVLELAERRMGTETGEPEEGKVYRWCMAEYCLENGKKVYRRFPALCGEDAPLLDEIVTDRAYQEICYTVYNEPFMALGDRLKITYDNGSGGEETEAFTVGELKNAYRQDLRDFTFTKQMEELVQGNIELDYSEKGVYASAAFPVYPSFANTIALLEKTGLYTEQYLDSDEVEQITVVNYNTDMNERYAEEFEYGEVYDMDFSVEESFSDPEEIRELCGALFPESFSIYWMPEKLDSDYFVTVIYKNGREDIGTYGRNFYILDGQAPDFVKERTAYQDNNS